MIKMRKKGFTIVELVIVIAVIAVLAAVLIPTFVNLTKRANESVDIQIVRNMNNVLKQEEAVKGKPENLQKVKTILSDNGISNYKASVDTYVYAWDPKENVIILVTRAGDQKAVFPEEYENVSYKDTWKLLAGTLIIEMETLGSTLDEALEKVKLGQEISLNSNQTLTSEYLPANVSINLNGYEIKTTKRLYIPVNGNVVITNGKYSGETIELKAGSTLTLNDVDVKTESHAIFAAGDASRIDIIGCNVEAYSAISTNASSGYGKNIIMNVIDTTIGNSECPAGTGVWINVPGELNVINSTIFATEQCVLARGGNVTIDGCTLNYVCENPYVEISNLVDKENKSDEENEENRWDQGNDIQKCPIVVGDWSPYRSDDGKYHWDATCTIKNTIINTPAGLGYPKVYLSQDSGNTTTLTFDSSVANNEYAVNNPTNENSWWYYSTSYGYVLIGKGTIIVNGEVVND